MNELETGYYPTLLARWKSCLPKGNRSSAKVRRSRRGPDLRLLFPFWRPGGHECADVRLDRMAPRVQDGPSRGPGMAIWTEILEQDVRDRCCAVPQDARCAGQWNGRGSTLVSLVVLFSVTAACGTLSASGLRFTGNGLVDAAQRWGKTAPARDREAIRRLKSDRTLLIHVIRGKIERGKSRGTAAYRASNPLAKRQCILHPPSDGIEPERNWDVVYDEELQVSMERELRLASPLEALLHHELLGHIALILYQGQKVTNVGDDAWWQAEDEAIRRENEYREAAHLPLVPWTFRRGKEH